MGGGASTAEKYAKFGAGEYSSSDFEGYVDSRPDLAAAWGKIESDPTAWDSKYWIDKGATSKSAFGRAHAAEDAELYAGTYGAGGTKVLPGTPEYKAYFPGDGTSFDAFTAEPAGGGGGGGGTSAPYASNPYYPQLVQNYERPGLLDWSGYMPEGGMFGHEQYQPWTNPNNIASNIFDYQPPRIHAGGYGGGESIGRSPAGAYGGGGIPTTPITTAATGGDEPTSQWVPETPITTTPYQDSFLGNVGADKAGTLGGLLDVATGASVFSPSDYTMQQASDAVREYAVQNLVKETPSLQDSFDMMSTLNLTPFTPTATERDRAQRNIDDAVAAMVKNNPEAARVMYGGAGFLDMTPLTVEHYQQYEGSGGA